MLFHTKARRFGGGEATLTLYDDKDEAKLSAKFSECPTELPDVCVVFVAGVQLKERLLIKAPDGKYFAMQLIYTLSKTYK